MFKKGDKVQRTTGTYEDMIPGEIATVEAQNSVLLYLEGYNSAHNPLNFKLVKEEKEEMQFDMHSHPWFIRVENEQEFNAARDWVESLGFKFEYGNKYEEDIVAISNYLNSSREVEPVIHKNKEQDDQSEYNEIKLTFKTVIDSATFPEVKTEQQKQIEELEKTIFLAKQQIEELKKI